ncbi:MAG: bacterial transcriptional activator domain-containing protein [Candidatus Eremiobacteraeota bacterium]|nr:bacterial transcriptional activator domain-containing protein [Candidatus Eremiobacteraeota bacterium]
MESGPSRLAHLLREAITIAESVPAETGVLSHLHRARTSLGDLETVPDLRVDVLSGLAFTASGQLALSPSETAVLVILGLNGRRMHRDVLAAELYGDGDPRNATNSLKVAVHRVRRRVGRADVIRRDRGGYALADWVIIDVPVLACTSGDCCSPPELRALELLRTRLRASRPGFMLEWAWFDETERRLRDLEHDVTVALAYHALRSRHHYAAIELADELAREDPLDESAVEIFLRAFGELGKGELAEVHYQRYASRVKRETDSAPSQELQRLVRSRGAVSTAAR